jgi:hypothetical protein
VRIERSVLTGTRGAQIVSAAATEIIGTRSRTMRAARRLPALLPLGGKLLLEDNTFQRGRKPICALPC